MQFSTAETRRFKTTAVSTPAAGPSRPASATSPSKSTPTPISTVVRSARLAEGDAACWLGCKLIVVGGFLFLAPLAQVPGIRRESTSHENVREQRRYCPALSVTDSGRPCHARDTRSCLAWAVSLASSKSDSSSRKTISSSHGECPTSDAQPLLSAHVIRNGHADCIPYFTYYRPSTRFLPPDRSFGALTARSLPFVWQQSRSGERRPPRRETEASRSSPRD